MAVIAHCVPFQLSIRFWERGPVRLTWPTAWQKETPAHDTELNALPRPVVGWGVVWSAHAVPFHSSLKDDPGADGVVSPFPTAMHQLALTQSMPVALGRGVPDVTGGVAAVVAARLVPFHWFPKMEFVPATVAVPRISHVVAATQETDERDVTVLPAGAAAVTNDHAVPFHVSATTAPWWTHPRRGRRWCPRTTPN